MLEGAAGPVVPFTPTPIDQFFSGVEELKGNGQLTIETCIQLLKGPSVEGKIEEGPLMEQLALIVKKGAKGVAKQTAQEVADLVYDSPLFAMGTEDQQRVISENTSWAAKKWAAFSGWVVRWAKTIANKFCKVTGITALVVRRKLLKYATTAMKETLKAKQFTPSSLAINFSVNFLKAIADDPDVKNLGERFLKFFLEKLELKMPEMEEKWAEAQEKLPKS
jgi:hypothetical protein